jgi:hypothetical protein
LAAIGYVDFNCRSRHCEPRNGEAIQRIASTFLDCFRLRLRNDAVGLKSRNDGNFLFDVANIQLFPCAFDFASFSFDFVDFCFKLPQSSIAGELRSKIP